MRRKPVQKLLRVLLAAAVVLLPGAAGAQITGGVVKIGVLTDMTSLFADLSGPGSVEAARMAVEAYGGKVAGVPIEVIYADHLNKADVGSATAREWFDQQKVDMIIDLNNSSVGLAVNEIARERGKPIIVTTAGSTEFTGKSCSPTTVHWTYDTYAIAKGTTTAVVAAGGTSWFFVTADFAFGQNLEREASRFIAAAGGKVLGSVRHPVNSADLSSYLLQAQGSGAQVIGLANSGSDLSNSIKQAAEFGIAGSGQKMAGLAIGLTDIHSVGLQVAQGLLLTSAFYWDTNDQTRAFAKTLASRNRNIYPDMYPAGTYAGVLHYLKAVEAAKSDDGKTVVAKMKEMPTDDPLFGKGTIRQDGRKIHPMYLFEVKKPAESKGEWDLYTLRATIPGDEAFRPLAESDCPLVKK
jgi:branched-chain amino acid transport system substrate-binding protein